ncbi:hypothetical protein [Tritonibacter scottomollicae]|uniref:hypothetical protein n=1 Tax=Tritonibacter scottomollicae TaxID=483013 RepID=UPI003AA8699C
MKMIPPVTVTPAMLHSTSVSETTSYSSGTTYDEGDEIELTSTHKRYQSVQGDNQGNDPSTDDGTWWLEMGASNRWRVFDNKIGLSTTRAGSIQYQVDITTRVTGVGLLAVSGSSVRIRLYDPVNAITTFDETRVATDTISIVDWWTYFNWEPAFETEFVFASLPGFAGNRVIIDIDAGTGNAEIGQIVLGNVITLGVPLEGGSVGIEDYSLVTTDDFGNTEVVERAYANTAEIEFGIPIIAGSRQERWVRRQLAAQRARPTLYFADESLIDAGTLVYGFYGDLSIPLRSAGMAFCSLELRGLT